jgi:hypothetical protein
MPDDVAAVFAIPAALEPVRQIVTPLELVDLVLVLLSVDIALPSALRKR